MDCKLARTVAIVGAGPGGLAACKAALEEGLRPTVFECAAGVGGLWRQDDSGKVWRSLRTNLSKFTCAFSDAPWPEDAADFPSGAEVAVYLERFARDNDLLRYIHFESRVTSIAPSGGEGGASWTVVYETKDASLSGAGAQCKSECFEFVVVASGIFSKPSMKLAGLESFPGTSLHAANYRGPEGFAGQRVLVVGGAFSGADLAVDLASAAAAVTVASRRPVWHLPREINSKPADLVFYSRSASDRNKGVALEELNARRHAFFGSIVGKAPECIRLPDPDKNELPFVAITDGFIAAVNEGKIAVKSQEVREMCGQKAVFVDGSSEEYDAVVFATGYQLDLPFFSDEMKQAIELDPSDLLQPAVLHKCVWRPELPNLAFVGLYRGPYFAGIELQARWACGVFSRRLTAPAAEEMKEGLQVERDVRSALPRPQFPHGDYVGMVETLAQLVGVHPTATLESRRDPSSTTAALGRLLYEGPLLPFHFRLEGFKANPEVARAAILACQEKYPVAAA